MKIQDVEHLTSSQKEQIVRLWNREYPKRIAHSAVDQFEKYLSGLHEKQHVLLINDRDDIKGWFVYFQRDNDTWFAMILDSSLQGQGFGSQLLSLGKEKNEVLNGWVIDHDRELKHDGSFYKSPIDFYRKNGFTILDQEKLEKMNISGIKVRWASSMN